MNITIEIANETIAAVTQLCNVTILEKLRDEVIIEIYKHALITTGWIFGLSAAAFIVGWMLAGWHARKRKIERS